MGIRINRVIGYGLTDIKADAANWSLETERRFNPHGYMYDPEAFSVEGYITYLSDQIAKSDISDPARLNRKISIRLIEEKLTQAYGFIGRSIVYEMEMGLENVMVCVPPTCTSSWIRHDDIIDYYDPTLTNGDRIASSVVELDRAIYPWDSYINIKNMPPVRLTGEAAHAYRIMLDMKDNNLTWTSSLFADMGVDDEYEVRQYIVPLIPPELVDLLKYLKFFKHESDIYELRPMIYTYWA